MIRKVKGGYVVVSHKGKRLTKPGSYSYALKRLRAIEYFKRHPRKNPLGINFRDNTLLVGFLLGGATVALLWWGKENIK